MTIAHYKAHLLSVPESQSVFNHLQPQQLEILGAIYIITSTEISVYQLSSVLSDVSAYYDDLIIYNNYFI